MSFKKFDRQQHYLKHSGKSAKQCRTGLLLPRAVVNARPAGLANPAVSANTFSAEIDNPVSYSIRGKTIGVALHLVHDNPYNARTIYKKGLIQELVGSLKAQGQLVPALAVEHPTLAGHYQLIDGHYRKKPSCMRV